MVLLKFENRQKANLVIQIYIFLAILFIASVLAIRLKIAAALLNQFLLLASPR
jgi:hypothetical protein